MVGETPQLHAGVYGARLTLSIQRNQGERAMPERAHVEVSDVILQRIYGEFIEMPGMRLTLSQAQRLWGLDERTCQVLLEYLVDMKFLCRSPHGNYGRTSDGTTPFPRPRMAKAGIDPSLDQAKRAAGRLRDS